jgi:hypothetical protein
VTVVGARELAQVDLTLDPEEVELGGSLVATVVASSAGRTPTGMVQVLVDGVVAGSGALDTAGQVRLRLTDLDDAGVFPVVAQYLGDAATHPPPLPP